ncbi:helix-turn-helix transcriptional regulator [Micromonospora chersina]|uniref:helix-turn-helix transcriptional regulator n=1 Tax=Micromonospora chersina TaxID=47854 RepID=UPI003D8D0A88
MTHSELQETPTITPAEIARLAGVGRAAVSNWRKRHADFPAPVGGTAASPEFDLGQVEQWLHAQGKLPELSSADRLWRHLAAASLSPAASLAAVGALLLARQRVQRPGRSADPQLKPLMPDIDALADELGPQGATRRSGPPTGDVLVRRSAASSPPGGDDRGCAADQR